MDLVVLAGGLGVRFGGLKQIQPVDEFGSFIIDYSIFDAIRCGFDRVVFVINRNNFDTFSNTIGKRLEGKIKVDYAFQDLSNLPQGYALPKDRVKPLGTAHAMLCAKGKVHGNFAVINADDFYGYDGIKTIANCLEHFVNEHEYALVGYDLEKTILNSGAVKRGVCVCSHDKLNQIAECEIIKCGNGYNCRRLDGESDPVVLHKTTPVSMNLFGFNCNIFKFLSEYFEIFLKNNLSNLKNCEFFISSFLSDLNKNHVTDIRLVKTSARWIGMTYKEDFDVVKSKLMSLRESKIYPSPLWN